MDLERAAFAMQFLTQFYLTDIDEELKKIAIRTLIQYFHEGEIKR